jgi:hypothetical protein
MLVLLSLMTLSCSKDIVCDCQGGEYFIFGHFYGECVGEACIETFKIQGGKLSEDTRDRYPGADPFDWKALPDDKYQLVKDLPATLPSELLAKSDQTFGCPDCADGGGLYIEVFQDGKKHSWWIDKIKAGQPDYLHDFTDQVGAAIALLQ